MMVFRHFWLAAAVCVLFMAAVLYAADTAISFSKTTFWADDVTMTLNWNCVPHFSSNKNDRLGLILPPGFRKSASAATGLDGEPMKCTFTTRETPSPITIATHLDTTGLVDNDGMITVLFDEAVNFADSCTLTCTHLTNKPTHADAASWIYDVTYDSSVADPTLIFNETLPLPAFTTPQFAPMVTTALQTGSLNAPFSARASSPLTFVVAARGPELADGQIFAFAFTDPWLQSRTAPEHVELTVTVGTAADLVLKGAIREGHTLYVPVTTAQLKNAPKEITSPYGSRLPMTLRLRGYARPRRAVANQAERVGVSRLLGGGVVFASENKNFALPTVVPAALKSYSLLPLVPLAGARGSLWVTVMYPNVDIIQRDTLSLALPTVDSKHWAFPPGQVFRRCHINGVLASSANIAPFSSTRSQLAMTVGADVLNTVAEGLFNTLTIECEGVSLPTVPTTAVSTLTGVLASPGFILASGDVGSCAALPRSGLLGDEAVASFELSSSVSSTQASLKVTVGKLGVLSASAGDAFEIVLPDDFTYTDSLDCDIEVGNRLINSTVTFDATNKFTPFRNVIRVILGDDIDDPAEQDPVFTCGSLLLPSYGREELRDGIVRLIYFGDKLSSTAYHDEFVAAEMTKALVSEFAPSTTLGTSRRRLTYSNPTASALSSVEIQVWPLVGRSDAAPPGSDDDTDVEITLDAGVAIELVFPASAVNAGQDGAATACDMSINVADAETSFANRVAVDTFAEMAPGFNPSAPTKTFARVRVRTQRRLRLSADLKRRRASITCTNIRLPAYGQSPSNVGVLTLVNAEDLPMSRRTDLNVAAITPAAMSGQITPKSTTTMMAGREATFDIRLVSTLSISAATIEAYDDSYFAIEVTMPSGYSIDTSRVITCSADRANDWHPVIPVPNDRALPTFRFNLKQSFAAIGARQPFTITCQYVSLPSQRTTTRGAWTARLLASPLDDIIGIASGEIEPVAAASYETEFGGVRRDINFLILSERTVSLTAIMEPAAAIRKSSDNEDDKVSLVLYLPQVIGLEEGITAPNAGPKPDGTPALQCSVRDDINPGSRSIPGTVEVEYITSDDLELSTYPSARVAKLSFVPTEDFVAPGGSGMGRMRFDCANLPMPSSDLPAIRDVFIGVAGTSQAVKQTSTNIAIIHPFNRFPTGTVNSTTYFSPSSLGAVGSYNLILTPVGQLEGVELRIPVPPGTRPGVEDVPIVCKVQTRVPVDINDPEAGEHDITVHTFERATLSHPFNSIRTSTVPRSFGLSPDATVVIQCSNVRAPSVPDRASGMQLTTYTASGVVRNRQLDVAFTGVGARVMEGKPTMKLVPSYMNTPTSLTIAFEVLPIDIVAGDKIIFDLPDGVIRSAATRCLINFSQSRSFALLCPPSKPEGAYTPCPTATENRETRRRLEIVVANTVSPASLRNGYTPVTCVFMTTPDTIASERNDFLLEVRSASNELRAVTKKLAFGGVLSTRLGAQNMQVTFSTPLSSQESTLSYDIAPLANELRNTDSLDLVFPPEYEIALMSNSACSVLHTARPGATPSRMEGKLQLLRDPATQGQRLKVSPTATVAATGETGTITVTCVEIRTPRTFAPASTARLELYRGGSPTAAAVNADVILPQIDYTTLASEFAFLVPGKSRLANTLTESLMLTLKPIPLVMHKFSGIEFVVPYGGFRLRTDQNGEVIDPQCKYLYQSGIMGTWVEVNGHTEVVATSSSLTVRFVASNSGLISKSDTLSKLSCSPIDVPVAPHPRTTNIVAVGLAPRDENVNKVTDDFIYSMRQTNVEMPALMLASEASLFETYVEHTVVISGLTTPITTIKRLDELTNTFSTTVVASGGLTGVDVAPLRQLVQQVTTSDYTVTLSFRVTRPASSTDSLEAFLDRIVLIRSDIDQSLRKETRGIAVVGGGVTLFDMPKTCRDGVRNGRETGVDCGGDQCKQCDVNQRCQRDSDCFSSRCNLVTGTCASITSRPSAAARPAAPLGAAVVGGILAAVIAAVALAA